jgi:hypothetical protein
MLDLTTEEKREAADALMYYIKAMLKGGQTSQEIEYRSLANSWSAHKKLAMDVLGESPAWMTQMEDEVQEAINYPQKRRNERR